MLKSVDKHKMQSSGVVWYLSIRTQLIAAFIFLLIPIAALGFISYSVSSRTVTDQVMAYATETNRQLTDYLNLVFSTVDDASLSIASSNIMENYLAGPADRSREAQNEHLSLGQELRAYLENYSQTHEFIGNLSLITADTELSLGTADFSKDHIDFNATEAALWYRQAIELQGGILWMGERPEIDRAFSVLGNYSLSSARSIRDSYTGNVAAVLVIDIELQAIEEIIKNVSMGIGSEIHLVSPEGRHISSRISQGTQQPGELLVNADITQEAFFKDILGSVEMEGSAAVVHRNTKHLMRYSKIGDTGFVLVHLMPMSTLLSTAHSIRNITIILGFIAVFFAILLGLAMSNRIGRIINRIIFTASKAAAGDLTIQPVPIHKDELGVLTKSINVMIADLRKLISDSSAISHDVTELAHVVAATAQHISSSSHEISQAMQEVAKGSTEQALDAEHGVQSMDVLSVKITQLSENATNIAKLSRETTELTEKGLSTVDNLDAKTTLTNVITKSIVADILALGEQSKTIGSIIQTIDRIAVQTNQLVLDMTAEDERFDEKEKGFEIVADQVRNLAEQSIFATKDIAAILKKTQKQTELAVENTKSAEEIVKSQVDAVTATIATFNGIAMSMKTLAKNLNLIMSAIVDIEQSKNHVLLTMQNMSAISEEAAAATQEVASSTEEQLAGVEELASYAEKLNHAAEHLTATISKFKIE